LNPHTREVFFLVRQEVYDLVRRVIDDTVLVQITGSRHGLPGTEVAIRLVDEPYSGLFKTSCVCGTNVLTAEQFVIDQTIDYLSDATMLKIANCLKVVLEL
jgi:hypothetical protein